MKIKKSELEKLIENFLFEDKTSDAFQSINVAGRNKMYVDNTEILSKSATDEMFTTELTIEE